jgi:hypothetical protein
VAGSSALVFGSALLSGGVAFGARMHMKSGTHEGVIPCNRQCRVRARGR